MTEREFKTLRCEWDGAVATITLDRPEALNALNAAMFDDLETAFAELGGNPGVRAILLTGSGDRAFAAGADIRELVQVDSTAGKAASERGQQVFAQIENSGKPVIACINGAALGGGLELALACTLRIASERAQLGLPEVKLGLVPGYGGTQRLARLIGHGAALRMMLTAQSVSPAEALRLGLVEEVVTAPELMSTGRALAERIAEMAPLAVAGVLEAVRRGMAGTIEGGFREEGFRAETEIFARLCGSTDKREGLAAFLEKRAAKWRGL